MYSMYIRVAIQGVLPCYPSIWRIFSKLKFLYVIASVSVAISWKGNDVICRKYSIRKYRIFHNPNNVWISSHKVRYHRAKHDIITKGYHSPCHCEQQQMLRRGNLAERNTPNGWIPTVTLFPRNDTGGTPTFESFVVQNGSGHNILLFSDSAEFCFVC